MFHKNRTFILLLTLAALVVLSGLPAQAKPGAPPSLSMPNDLQTNLGAQESIPVQFNDADNEITRMNFSIDFDQDRLAFDPTDSNSDGVPDSVIFTLPADFARQVTYNAADTDGELDFVIADLISPTAVLTTSQLASIEFTGAAPGVAAVGFSTAPTATFTNTLGAGVAGVTIDGAIQVIPLYRVYLPMMRKNYPPSYSISGRITESILPLPGVLVTLNNGQTTYTNSSGDYQFTKLLPGTYTVVPSLTGYLFSPPSRVLSLPPSQGSQDFTATRIYTPTPTPTVTPTGGLCYDLILNPNFERIEVWVTPDSEAIALYSDAIAYNGEWSMRAGIVNPTLNKNASSWFYQEVDMPATLTSAKLSFYYYPQTSAGSSEGDLQRFVILDRNNFIIKTLDGGLSNDAEWIYFEHGLKDMAGQTIRVAFEVLNDGTGGITVMYIDKVSLYVCR